MRAEDRAPRPAPAAKLDLEHAAKIIAVKCKRRRDFLKGVVFCF